MHEHTLIADLLRKIQAIAAAEGAARITAVKVRLGALSHISAGHFREHFDHGVTGTLADGAALTVVEDTDPDDPHAQDIRLVSVEVES